MKGVFIIIPAYNEAKIIGKILNEILNENRNYNIVVVDDGSIDETAEIASKHNIYVLKHFVNLGQGASLKTGFDFALKKKAKYVVTFDADGQMAVNEINDLIKRLKNQNVEVVLGSRFLKKKPINLSIIKMIVLKVALMFTKLTIKLNITDVHNGFRAFDASALRKINLSQNGMAHATEILNEIFKNKISYMEFPVKIEYTKYSISKGQSIINSLKILLELFRG